MNATNSAQVDVEYVTPGIVYMARKHRGLHGYLYRVWYPIWLEESWGNSQNFLTFRSRLYTQRSQNGSSWLHTQLWFYFIDYLLTIAHLNFVQFYVIVLNILYDIIWYYMILYDIMILWPFMIPTAMAFRIRPKFGLSHGNGFFLRWSRFWSSTHPFVPFAAWLLVH